MIVTQSPRSTMPGAESFRFDASGEVACVLVHGFTGSAHEMRSLGWHLHEQGVTTLGVLLSGHGTSPEEMAAYHYRHWLSDVETAVERLEAEGKRVFLCGLSMGGTLALNVAARRQHDPSLAGVVSMAAPLRLVDWRLRLLPIVGLVKRWHSWGRPDIKDETRWEQHVAYGRFHINALIQLLRLLRETRRLLPRVHQPLLVLFGRDDHTVPLFNAELVMRRVSSFDRRLVWLDNCYHVMTLDFDSELVHREVAAFIRERSLAWDPGTFSLSSQLR
jgi:carboxylesterase